LSKIIPFHTPLDFFHFQVKLSGKQNYLHEGFHSPRHSQALHGAAALFLLWNVNKVFVRLSNRQKSLGSKAGGQHNHVDLPMLTPIACLPVFVIQPEPL